MTADDPVLVFFRDRPKNWRTSPFVASSLQSLETSFFLLALDRYPHALSVCTSAIESALQASAIGAHKGDRLQNLIESAKTASSAVASFPTGSLDELRQTRNRFTHRGFSPRDDSVSVSLYLDVAIPFLCLCYREFHAFDLMEGLLAEYARHIRVGQRVHSLVRGTDHLDVSYCLRALRDTVRWCFKREFSSHWEISALLKAEDGWGKFEAVRSTRESLEKLFDHNTWLFKCPVCDEHEGAVVELDPAALQRNEVRISRLACVGCGFLVRESEPHLAEVLLEQQLDGVVDDIRREFGLI